METTWPFTYKIPSAAPFHNNGESTRQSLSALQPNIYCRINSFSVRTFHSVLADASTSIDLRIKSAVMCISPQRITISRECPTELEKRDSHLLHTSLCRKVVRQKQKRSMTTRRVKLAAS